MNLNKIKSPQAFRTISETSIEVDVPTHVLRFWETKFTKVNPLKRSGNRRYYRPEDIILLKKIKTLLYENRYTIKGVQKILKNNKSFYLSDNETDKNNKDVKKSKTLFMNEIDLLEVKKLLTDFDKLIEKI